VIIIWIYGKRLTYRYDISWVAYYTIDMVSDLYNGYGIELCIGYGLILMVDVMLVGCLIHGIE
jgi:hypothetical protein